MKRRFIYQDAKSDKFWDIDFEGTTQTVVYGKTGTAGREAVKEFATPEECTKESEKLILQKLKKGYTELKEGEAAPEKREYSEEEKADYFFWEAIEKSYKYNKKDWEAYDLDEHLEKLTTYLSKYSEERLILFEKTLEQKLILPLLPNFILFLIMNMRKRAILTTLMALSPMMASFISAVGCYSKEKNSMRILPKI